MTTAEPLITGTALDDRLRSLASWRGENGWLVREYPTSGWRATMLVVGAIGFLAEAANHHPDLGVHWGRVVVRLQTHSAGGVTEKDLQLAQQIEATVGWQPAGGFPGLEGQPPDNWITR